MTKDRVVAPFAIAFRLRNVDEIEPWGTPGDKRLSWYGLTDGCYCIETPAGRLLEHRGEADPGLGEPWCDYQVGRIFEDLLTAWPVICDPIPDAIMRCFATAHGGDPSPPGQDVAPALADALDRWLADRRARPDDDPEVEEAIDVVESWMEQRTIRFGYMQPSPRLRLWRTGSNMHLAWDAEPPWSQARVRVTVPFAAVREGIEAFFTEFLDAMAMRVSDVLRDGWSGKPCTIDLQRLAEEPEERSDMAEAALSRTGPNEWQLIEENIQRIDDKSDRR